MSKYQALIDALAYAKQTGGIGLTASVADLDALLADLEGAETALAAIAQQAHPVDALPDLNPEDIVVDVVLKQLGGFAPVTTHGVRVAHKPSRISVVVDSERSQHRNRQLALEALRAIIHPQAHPVPAPVGEREAFETWAKQRWLPLDRCEIGGASYRIVETNLAWCAWQARAARQSPAPQTKGQP